MSVKKGRLKYTVIFSYVILFTSLLFVSGYSLLALNNIKESVRGLALGFYQYDALAQTSARLQFEGLTATQRSAALAEVARAYNGFLQVAPVKTESGVKMTREITSAIESIKQEPTRENVNTFNKLARNFRGLIVKYDVQGTQDYVASAHRFTVITIITTLSAFLIASVILFFILRNEFLSITNTIKKNIHRISQGDLHHDADNSGGDINGVHHELDGMRASLTKITASLKTSAAQIKLISGEMASGNHDLASRTEQQASALQQTAASMEEIKTTVVGNTEHAHQANMLAAKANEIAQAGAQSMSIVIAGMKKIEQSTAHIAEINHVINGIAHQTNILALNAAVEAARAGERGRGFAVVASEVRSLARRSAEAADEINSLIQGSMHDVSAGANQVQDAAKAMEDVVDSISQVSAIMNEITHSSEEQRTGVNQVAVALNEMDRATQQNAARGEQSAGIAQSMDQYAQQLADVVAFFSLDEQKKTPSVH